MPSLRDTSSISHSDTPSTVGMTAVPDLKARQPPLRSTRFLIKEGSQFFHSRRSGRVIPFSYQFRFLCLFVYPDHGIGLQRSKFRSNIRTTPIQGRTGCSITFQARYLGQGYHCVSLKDILVVQATHLWIPHLTGEQRMRIHRLVEHCRIEVR